VLYSNPTLAAQRGAGFELGEGELAAAKLAARRVSRLEADTLLQHCEREVCGAVRETFQKKFREEFIETLRSEISSSIDRNEVRNDLKKQGKSVKLCRFQYSFNKMSQGKTKVHTRSILPTSPTTSRSSVV
jgi:hypothetical protein